MSVLLRRPASHASSIPYLLAQLLAPISDSVKELLTCMPSNAELGLSSLDFWVTGSKRARNVMSTGILWSEFERVLNPKCPLQHFAT